MPVPEFSIRFERLGVKARDLVYEESGARAVIPLDMSGVPAFDWVGATDCLKTWTEPRGEPIPTAKQQEILKRVQAWSAAQGVRLDLGPGGGMEQYLDPFIRKGYTWHTGADGTRTLRSPDHRTWLRRALDLLRRRRR